MCRCVVVRGAFVHEKMILLQYRSDRWYKCSPTGMFYQVMLLYWLQYGLASPVVNLFMHSHIITIMNAVQRAWLNLLITSLLQVLLFSKRDLRRSRSYKGDLRRSRWCWVIPQLFVCLPCRETKGNCVFDCQRRQLELSPVGERHWTQCRRSPTGLFLSCHTFVCALVST